MGFWQGLNEGLTYVMEQRERKRMEEARREEIQTERDIRARERAEDRTFAQEQFMLQVREGRRDKILELARNRDSLGEDAAEITGKANSLLSALEGVDDPRVEALRNNPRLAAALEDQRQEVLLLRAKNDVDAPPLVGQTLLDTMTLQLPDGSVGASGLSVEDILEMDFSDPLVYEQTLQALGTAPGGYGKINPEAYRIPKKDVLEPGRKAFDMEVLRLANQALDVAKQNSDTATSAELQALVKDYGGEKSGSTFRLRDMFGDQAIQTLSAMESPYVQNLLEDPELSRYSRMFELQQIIADPRASEEDRQRASSLLAQIKGGR